MTTKGKEPAFLFRNDLEAQTQLESASSWGLSKREWFAGMAMQGMMGRDTFDGGQATPEQRARLAVIEADALLKELEKTKE